MNLIGENMHVDKFLGKSPLLLFSFKECDPKSKKTVEFGVGNPCDWGFDSIAIVSLWNLISIVDTYVIHFCYISFSVKLYSLFPPFILAHDSTGLHDPADDHENVLACSKPQLEDSLKKIKLRETNSGNFY